MKKQAKSATPKYKIPVGYKQTKSDGMSETVDWDKTPEVQGEVVEIKTIPEKVGKDSKGKKKILRNETRLMIVKIKNGDHVAVWEKKQLESLFEAVEEGSFVYIRHTGTVEIPGRQLPMHEFVTAIK